MRVRDSFHSPGRAFGEASTVFALLFAAYSLFVSVRELAITVKYGILLPHGPSLLLAPWVGLVLGLLSGTRWGRRAALGSAGSLILMAVTSVLLSMNLGRGPRNEEAQVEGDVRYLISAQQTFANFNGGFFAGDIECLSEPERCLADLPQEIPQLLGPDITRLGRKSGYERSFIAGPPAEPAPGSTRTDGGPLSSASVTSYAYIAIRTIPYKEARNFCGDSTGTVCYTENGALPEVAGGLCVECTPLQ